MIKGLVRFALIWGLSVLLTPYVNRFLNTLAARAPKESFLEAILLELSDQYSSSLVNTLGQTVGELFLGSKRR
jgi:hypothetical protein